MRLSPTASHEVDARRRGTIYALAVIYLKRKPGYWLRP